MEKTNQLTEDYENNYKKVQELALNTVATIEIPVYNKLAVISKHDFTHFLNILLSNLNELSLHEMSLALTVVADVLTSVIKYNYFFISYTNNNIQLIQMFCKKICYILRKIATKEECTVINADLKLMEKYAKRIAYDQFKNILISCQEKLTLLEKRKTMSQNVTPDRLDFHDYKIDDWAEKTDATAKPLKRTICDSPCLINVKQPIPPKKIKLNAFSILMNNLVQKKPN